MATITVPDNLRDIAYQAFENTAWLNNAPDGVVYLGKVAYCYKGEMPAGTSITLRDGTLATAEGAFESQDNLTGVTLPMFQISATGTNTIFLKTNLLENDIDKKIMKSRC